MHDYSKELKIAIKAAKEAGKILSKHFLMSHKVTYKTQREEFTEVDKLAEKKILSILKKSGYGILSEESGRMGSGNVEWVVDPLDGTTNYSIRVPFFNTAIALAVRGKPVVAVVYAPLTGEMFTAVDGEGSWLNGKRMHVSEEKELERSLVTYCHGTTPEGMKRHMEVYGRLKEKVRVFYQPRAGNLELAFIAAGRIDAFVSNNAMPWDSACGALMVREAGGVVTDFKGKQWDMESSDMVASGKGLHFKLLKAVSGI